MIVYKIFFPFSIQQLASQRVKYQHKICFKPTLAHLKLKSNPTWSVISRITRDGKSLLFYKLLRKAYISKILPLITKLPQNNEFKNLYDQYESFNDLDRVLFWKLISVNCLFSLKRKNNLNSLYYLKPERRVVLALSWLKNFMQLNKKNFNNSRCVFFQPVFNFISTNKAGNNLFYLKLRIYKLRLARG